MGKRILYAASNMQHINNFHLDYIAALRNEGHKVWIMARGEGADFDIPFVKKFFSAENRLARAMIREIAEREKFDLIILNTSLAAFHIRCALPRKGRPRVVNFVHGYLFSEDVNPLKRAALIGAEWVCRRRTDAVIVMNKKDEDYAKKYKLTRGEVLFTLGMGVPEPQEDAPDCRDRAFGEGDEWRMLFVGELSSRKNQRFLIAALPEISQRVPRAALYLAGEGDARDELVALAAGLSVSDRVHFLGKRTDVRRLMRECDLYISAAMIEGMPFNLIEAMDEGATVLASRIKGHEDLVSDGEDGFLFEFGNKDEFVNKACQIADGASVLDKEKIISKAKKYSKNNVFRDTLGILKRASGLGEGEEN